jgi:hypothetical protein
MINLPPKRPKKKSQAENITVSLRIEPSLHAFYKDQAQSRGLKISDLISRVLEDGRTGIERMEATEKKNQK